MISALLRVVNGVQDRNYRIGWMLSRRCGRWGMFNCRGRIQATLEDGGTIRAPTLPVSIGIPLLGNLTPRSSVTVLAVGARADLSLDGCSVGRGAMISVGKEASVAIGQGTYITDGSKVLASQRIVIGIGCAISWGVTILDDDGHGFGPPPYSAPIHIEDRVWIGCNATVLKGVTIGAGSVVAAGAIVTRSCPAASLVGGVPARIIRSDVSWTDAARIRLTGGA